MDFLEGPAAIHSSTTTYSSATQSPSPNELINPKISMKNHQIFTYSFLGSGPAIFPCSVMSSHARIVLLSEASSSSHVRFQRGPTSSEGFSGPRQISPNYKIQVISMHARDLGPIQSRAYGFSGWSCCNPQQHNNIFYKARAQTN